MLSGKSTSPSPAVAPSGVGSGIFGAGGLFFIGSPNHYVRVVEKWG
jgi:hypothetical protein